MGRSPTPDVVRRFERGTTRRLPQIDHMLNHGKVEGTRPPTLTRWVSRLLAAAVASACTSGTSSPGAPALPHRTPSAKLDASAVIEMKRAANGALDAAATTRLEASRYVVASTSGREAIRAGEAVLAEGGNAMDAALSVALDQVVLSGGSWNSLAGIGALLYYDSQSGETHALDASFRAFVDELHPETIPAAKAPSGRSALVPGFMAMVQAGHDRFGSLPLRRLFAPAIAHAQNGVVVGEVLQSLFAQRQNVLLRLEATRKVYAPEGALPQLGELFMQPDLAQTLRELSERGSSYMYEGAWARHFVEAVRAEGGKASLQDLRDYRVEWSAPRCIEYHQAQVCSTGGRSLGGTSLLETLLLARTAGLDGLGSMAESADVLYWSVRALQVGAVLQFAPRFLRSNPSFISDQLSGVALDAESRLTAEQAQRIASYIGSGRWDQVMLELSVAAAASHSDAIAVVDAAGNAVALTHSIHTNAWGDTGLNVDGVSIPDAAAAQPGALILAGPGGYVGSGLNPALVFQSQVLRLAASAIGNVHYAMFGHLRAWLDLGARGVPDASGLTLFDVPSEPRVGGGPYQELVPPGSVPAPLLTAARERGLLVREGVDDVPHYWVGVEVAPTRPRPLAAVVSPGVTRFGGGVAGR